MLPHDRRSVDCAGLTGRWLTPGSGRKSLGENPEIHRWTLSTATRSVTSSASSRARKGRIWSERFERGEATAYQAAVEAGIRKRARPLEVDTSAARRREFRRHPDRVRCDAEMWYGPGRRVRVRDRRTGSPLLDREPRAIDADARGRRQKAVGMVALRGRRPPLSRPRPARGRRCSRPVSSAPRKRPSC